MLTSQEIRRGFRIVLQRDPESQETIEQHRSLSSFDELISVLMRSEEFLSRFIGTFPHEKWVMTKISETNDRIYVDLSDQYVSRGCLYGNYEFHESNFVKSIVRPSETVLDIGANIGWFTIIMARLVGPLGKVHAFEPRPNTFNYLKKTVKENFLDDIVTLYPQAVSDIAREMCITWRPSSHNPGNSWLSLPNDDPDAKQDITTCIRLDDIGLGPVSFIKLDVEGAEPKVLRGASRLIKRDAPIILSEINFGQLQMMVGMGWREYREFLISLDYDSFALIDGKGATTVAEAEERGIDVVSIAMWLSDRCGTLQPQDIWE